MGSQYKRSWVLLTSFASCAALASTLAFAEEPRASMQHAHAGDVQYVGQQPDSAQTIYLIKLLQSSSQFRVRAQAAISLGLVEKSPAARHALTAALQDSHPAVRAAAATSLGRIGDSNHVTALRKLGVDPEGPVRNAARASLDRIEHASLERLATAALSTDANANRL